MPFQWFFIVLLPIKDVLKVFLQGLPYKGMFRSAGFLVLKVILGHFLIFFEA